MPGVDDLCDVPTEGQVDAGTSGYAVAGVREVVRPTIALKVADVKGRWMAKGSS